MDKWQRRVLSMAPCCLFWCVWQQRNRKTFDGVEPNDLRLKESLIRSLVNWSGILLGRDCASLLDFVEDLNCG